MKLVFVDAENVGCSIIKGMKYKLNDKVLVFSRHEKIQAICSEKLFTSVSHYEDGSNQADFLIMATLGELLASMSTVERRHIVCELVTHDLSLIQAFISYCKRWEVSFEVAGQRTEQVNDTLLEKRVLKVLQVPHALNHLFWGKVGLDQSTCNRITTKLASQKKIKRVDGKDKLWVNNTGVV